MKFTFSPESRPLGGFTIKRAIYRGGFGEVYYAVSDAGRDVALKLLQNNAEVELRGVQQCLNLSHPNLVTIFDVRRDEDGDHWIVMEFVPGETLDATIRRYPNGMPMEEVRRWIAGISAGVDFLHQRGIVHRDLKPGNIFATPSGAKVGDVGLSKFISTSQRSAQTQSVGTVYYMAPEVAQGRYGKEIDVYALGIMLFEMLTGQVPFDGESTGEILMKHMTQPPDLRRLPERLRPVVARALAKDPGQRFSTIDAFRRAFEDAVVGRSASVEPKRRFGSCGTQADRPEGWARRNPPQPWGACSTKPVRNAVLGQWFAIIALVMVLLSLLQGNLNPATIVVAAIALFYVFGYGAFTLGRAVWRETQTLFTSSTHPLPTFPAMAPGDGRTSRGVRTIASPSNVERWLAWTSTCAIVPFVVVPLSAGIAWFQPSLFWAHGAIDAGALGLFAGTAVLATWVLSAVSSFHEGRGTDGMTRRIGLGLGGAAVGVAAGILGEWLLGTLIGSSKGFHSLGERPLTDPSGNPSVLAFSLYFGTLAASVRWWRQSTALRSGRFQVAPLLVSILTAYGLTFLWPVPQEWGVMWGAVISTALQVASPWTPPEARRTLV